MEESCIPSNIQWITHFLTNPKITNQNTIGSGICSVKAWTTIIWYLCRLVYPREISQATMMAGSSRWQSAVIGGNGAWRSRMRTMNPKSNRTCLYRRSDRGPVLWFNDAMWCHIFWSTLVCLSVTWEYQAITRTNANITSPWPTWSWHQIRQPHIREYEASEYEA